MYSCFSKSEKNYKNHETNRINAKHLLVADSCRNLCTNRKTEHFCQE